MVEQYAFGRGGQQSGHLPSFMENLNPEDGRSLKPETGDSTLNLAALEMAEQFQKVVEQAYQTISPIIERINRLPDEYRQQFVASIGDMEGHGYDAVRKFCA